ncbi:MAG: hypothetical protein OEV28_12775, partial [Nitrospirota bacterium]|nr:hypothetical protein [Nitrospirota bacterium]
MGKKKVTPLTRAGWWVTAVLARGIVGLLRGVSLDRARAMGRRLGGLVFAVDAKHRAIALENLRRAFPEKDDAWRLATARRSMENLVENFFEFFHLSDKDKETVLGRVCTTGIENIDEAGLRDKGYLYLTGHCGNWEVIALAYTARGFLSSAVARPLDNPWLNDLIDGMRSRFGGKIISKRNGMRQIIRATASGECIGILLDQNVDRKEGVFVDFFGEPACTNKGLALLARK